MTRITLAYEYEGHEPDETIDVEPDVARRLVHDGRARVPDGEDVAPELAAVAPPAATVVAEEPTPKRSRTTQT
jgi:hypothetical protein